MFLDKLMHIYTQLFDSALPHLCILCGYTTANTCLICNPCQRDLPALPHSCRQCAQFLRFTDISQLKCGACLSEAPPFDVTHALFPYESPVDSLITKLKFQQQILYAKAFAELMAKRIKTDWYRHQALPDLIIPIPLHPARLKERGFNQSLEIARHLAKSIKLPLDYQGIKRIKPTLAQSGLSAGARKRNIMQGFSVSGNYHGLNIALVDDVVTTGSTVQECSRMLKKSGAASVHIWCCARNG